MTARQTACRLEHGYSSKVMDDRFKALDKSIWDSVKEEQVKLGYCREVIRLYYPIESVERMLKAEGTSESADFSAGADNRATVGAGSRTETGISEAAKAAKAANDENAGLRTDLTLLLDAFRAAERDTLGDIRISCDGERYCFRLPEEASEYVHEHTASSGFLYDFIAVIGRHGARIEEVEAVFRKYSECVHIEKLVSEDFDYLMYFEDGVPDDYRYCLTDEGHHIIYHRFTPQDYEALGI